MKKKSFEISAEQMPEFSEILAESELDNEVAGKTDDDNIIINVFYEPEDKQKILELWEWLEDGEDED